MAKQNGNGNGNGDDKTTWMKAGEAAGNVMLGRPVVEGVKAIYNYMNPQEKKVAVKPTKGGANKGAPKPENKTPVQEQKGKLKQEYKKGGTLEAIKMADKKGQKNQAPIRMDPKKAQPIKTSEPRSSIEKLPEPPKPKHKLSPKEVVTNIKLGINDIRQRNEDSRNS